MNLISKYKLLNVLYLFAISIGITFLVITFVSAISSLINTRPLSISRVLAGFLDRSAFLYDYFYLLTSLWFVILLIIYLVKSRKMQQH